MGVALSLFGAALLLFGNRENLPLKAVHSDGEVPLDVQQTLRRHERPFVFCTHCQGVTEHLYCEGCSSPAHTIEVREDADVEVVLAVLESDPGEASAR